MTKLPVRVRIMAHATPMKKDDRYERQITLLLLMIACLLSLLVSGCFEKRPLPRADQRALSRSSKIKCSQFHRTNSPSGYRGWKVVRLTEYHAVLQKGRNTITIPCK